MSRVLERLDGSLVTGLVIAVVTNADGSIDRIVRTRNLITTSGDQFHAKKIAGVTVTAPNGMKLGTGTTAEAKSGTGAALVTYLAGSNQLLDATYPQASAKAGTDAGWQVTWQCTWPAGDLSATGIAEVALVTDADVNATSSSTNTYARAKFGAAQDVALSQSLTVIWNQLHLGV